MPSIYYVHTSCTLNSNLFVCLIVSIFVDRFADLHLKLFMYHVVLFIRVRACIAYIQVNLWRKACRD